MAGTDAESIAALTTTRRALHAIAELVLAAPQLRTSASIELRVSPRGFRTVAEPHLNGPEPTCWPKAGPSRRRAPDHRRLGAG